MTGKLNKAVSQHVEVFIFARKLLT